MLSESLKGREGLPELDSDVTHQVAVQRQVASRVEDSGLHHGVCHTLGFCPLPSSTHNLTPNTSRQNHGMLNNWLFLPPGEADTCFK